MPRRLPDMAERCRICLVDHGCMTSLHDERVKITLKDLAKCTSTDIKHDNLPSVVCHVCLYKLDMWSNFKQQFIQSNKILLEQLQVSEVSDNANKEDRPSAENMKRRHSNQSGQDSASDNNKKKSKMEVASSELVSIDCVTDQPASKTDKIKKDAENGNEEQGENKSSSGPMRIRLLQGRRGRAIERRKASTKRWVERKKALLAATGENVSDTDSVISDDTQLSPVQKARAKTNADKEAERQKRIAKVLKNLETNLTEKYTAIRDNDYSIVGDTDSDTRRTRLSKESPLNAARERNKNSLLKQQAEKQDNIKRDRFTSQENSMGKENPKVPTNNISVDCSKKSKSRDNDESLPNSMKSELVIGDTSYIITSTLVDSSHLDKGNLNNLTKDSKDVDESSHEKNTDIIDAVQLRRIHPVSNSNNKKFVERCLNIEVEGTELETLKRVQIELSEFINKEIKQKLFGTNCSAAKTDKTENTCAKPFRKLDQQLKNMIEKTIRNNIESCLIRDTSDASKAHGQQSIQVSPALVKTAMNSPKYQPKVVLKRLDLAKESKRYKINIVNAFKHATPKNKLAGPFSAISRKRQSVFPTRYNDYNTSALDSDSNESDNVIIESTPRSTNVRTYGNLTMKSPGANNRIAIIKRLDSSVKTTANSITPVSIISIGQNSTAAANGQKPDYEDAIKIEGAIAENHICGVCGLSFNSRKDVEAHVRTHKLASAENNVEAPRQNQKQKMMRCRRCQEIVEARYVKAHTCKMMMMHKCYVCNCTFRTEKLLVRHLESHDQSEFNIENIAKVESKKPSNINASKAASSILILSTKPEKGQIQKMETSPKTLNILTEKNDIQSDKITTSGITTGMKLVGDMEKPKETYTCFVCDKIFTDEEVLKDHLQKHCDDLSEGEQSNSKEQYQCAICGDTLESDQALEEHVGKHLFDDEDDNPNLISIDQENEKANNPSYHCGQCSDTFDSELLLEMHIHAHEEETAIAEWEKKGMNIHPYQCMLCEQSELIETEEELTQHLNLIHNIHDGNAEVCQLCDKSFRTLQDLQEHVATH